MILTVDIGNTAISFGLFGENKKGVYASIETEVFLKKGIPASLRKKKAKVKACVISSVVPRLTSRLIKKIKAEYACKANVIGNDIVLTIPHSYKKINTLGKDRLVNIYGALLVYEPPFVVIDYGTAITFDYVNKEGTFEGGLIVPGIETSFNALSERGALLPKGGRITKPRTFLGRDTASGMNAGTVYGFASLTDGLIKRFRSQCDNNIKVIATGGTASFIHPYCKEKIILKPHHTLESLYCVAKIVQDM